MSNKKPAPKPNQQKKPAVSNQKTSQKLSGAKTATNLLPSARNQLFIVLGLLFVIFLVYSPSFRNQFINYDDDYYILENPQVNQFDFSHLGEIFKKPFGSQYAPLPFIALGIIHMMVGFVPKYYIIFGLLMHLTVTLLTFIFIRNLTGKFKVAILTAALFGLAPMLVEAVTWVSGATKTPSYSIFFLGALITYLKYTKTNKIKYMIYSIILFVCSCLCKEQAVALTPALVVIDLFLKRKIFSFKVIAEKIPFFLVSLIFGIVTIWASGTIKDVGYTEEFSIGDRIIYLSYSFVNYLGKLIVPYKLSFFYPYPSMKKLGSMMYVYPVLFFIIISLFIWAIKKKKDYIIFGGLFFLVCIMFSLAIQVISVREVIMADRYVYMASIGFFFIIAYGATEIAERLKMNKNAIFVPFFIYLSIMGYLTSQRSLVWKDTITATTDVLNNFESPLAYVNRGYEYRQQKKYDKALSDYNNAIRVNPKYALAYRNRGVIYFMQEKDDLALADYTKSIECDSTVAESFANRGAVYARTGKNDLALKDFARALEMDPNQKDALNNRSLLYYQMGKYKESIADLDKFLVQFPTESPSYNLRALCKTAIADYDGALKDYDLALRYKPNDGITYQNRSLMFYRKGDKVNALKEARLAQQNGIQLDPNYLNALK